MIYTTCVMAYATFAYGRPQHQQTLIAVGLIALALWISVYYHMSQNPVFHQVAYAMLTCAVVFRGMYVMEWHLRPALRKRSDNPEFGDAIMAQMWKMAITGLSPIHPQKQQTVRANDAKPPQASSCFWWDSSSGTWTICSASIC